MSEISIWPLRKTWLMTHFPSSGTGQNSTVRYDTRLNTLIQLTFPPLTVPLLDRRVEVCAGLFFFVPLPQGYILLPATPTIYSLFVHPLSALNNFLPYPTVPAKFRSCFQNLTFKFPLLKERDRLTNKSVVCTELYLLFYSSCQESWIYWHWLSFIWISLS